MTDMPSPCYALDTEELEEISSRLSVVETELRDLVQWKEGSEGYLGFSFLYAAYEQLKCDGILRCNSVADWCERTAEGVETVAHTGVLTDEQLKESFMHTSIGDN